LEVALSIDKLTKRYGATTALEAVSFLVGRGTTHAIIGENGAGKSTLIKALSGLQLPDSGSMTLRGQPYSPRALSDSRRAGVATAFQDLSLLSNLTVAENLLLPSLGRGRGLLHQKENERTASTVLAEFNLPHISPRQEVVSLSLADRQKLEIVRAISQAPQLLLLDEPSAALPDVEWLYNTLAQVDSAELTVLYISHRLNEIRDLCEAATVLRNGRVVDTVRIGDVDDSVIFGLMGGASEGHRDGARARHQTTGPPAIVVSDLKGHRVNGVSFSVHRGEIVGVAALEGQGQAETFRMLAGVGRPSSGTIAVDGKVVGLHSPAAAIRHGISFVPEERKTEGIFPGLSTLANVTITSLGKGSRAGLMRSKKERLATLGSAREVDLSQRYLNMDIEALSGGNQQKAVLARSLMKGATYLLLYDPSRGVDVGTKSSIYDLMERFVGPGDRAILWYSTDLAELTGVCDRILCFYKGSVVAEISGDESTVDTLLQGITGHRGSTEQETLT